MATSKNLQSLLTRILRQAIKLVGADGASIFLKEGNRLALRATTGSLPERGVDSSTISYAEGEGLTGWVFKHERWLLIPAQDPTSREGLIDDHGGRGKYDELEHPASMLEALMAVPIVLENGEVIGVLRCTTIHNSTGSSKSRTFTPENVQTLEIFAQTAAAAIEATEELEIATSAPYAFVLMPFASEHTDTYELAIRPVAKDLLFRCERVDEIEFNDSILAQIYKGIQSADIVIAEMTDRNPNVFYEVGYAHALRKEVVLLTRDARDIPFDLKGHNHVIYDGSLTLLKEQLRKRLSAWLEAHDEKS